MRRVRNLSVFVFLAGLWGLSFPAISAGLETLPPLLFATARYAVGGVALLAFLVVRGSGWRPKTREDAVAIAVAATFLIFGNSMLFVGQQTVPSGIAAIVYSLIPILTTAFAAVVLPGEPITHRRLVGVAVGFLGVGVIANPDPTNLFTAEVLGLVFVLSAAGSVSLGSVLLRTRSPTLGVGPMTAWAMLVGGAMLAVASYTLGERPTAVDPSAVAVVAVVYLGIFASALAYVIYFTLLNRYGPLEINLVSYVVPLFATVGGVVFLGEVLTPPMVAGFVLVAGGFAVLKAETIAEELHVRV